VNAPGKGAYPISSFTWLLVYRDQRDPAKGKQLTDFLRWYLTNGEAEAPALQYAPLPQAIVRALETRIDSIKVGATA
jgi:phosphate transport system substrate-binding protein